jgi:hypothetical protein
MANPNPMPVVRPLCPWLVTRLASTMRDDRVRYEASLYGPLDRLLNHIFPQEQTFLIKPQGALRKTIDPQPVDIQPGTRASIDSMNGPVLSRSTVAGQGRQEVLAPDFIVVKAGPHYGDDVPLAIVEVKNHWSGNPSAEDVFQMYKYMVNISAKSPANDFRGYLVIKRTTYVYGLPVGQNTFPPLLDTISTLEDLKGHLEILAAAHW